MNLVDNNRDSYGLIFDSVHYGAVPSPTVIKHKLLPDINPSSYVADSLPVALKHVSIIAYTVDSYFNSDTQQHELFWNLKHTEEMHRIGLISKTSSTYLIEEILSEMLDEHISLCVEAHNNIETLARFSSILQATGYHSISLASDYAADETFTNDMILSLGMQGLKSGVPADEKEAKHNIRMIHELPSIYYETILKP